MSFPLAGGECLLRIASDVPGAEPLLIEGVRISGWTLSNETVDVTDFGDNGWRRLLSGAGRRSLEIAMSGLYLGSPGEHRLRDLALTGRSFGCEVVVDSGSFLQADFIVANLSVDSAVNEEATYAAKLRSSGTLNFT